MHNANDKPPLLAELRLKYRNRFDAAAMLIYLCLVYLWALRVYPLGRDYAILAGAGEGLPFLVRGLVAWEIRTFADSLVGYHLVNMALLYASMLLIYAFTNYAVKGLWWMGTLAATLFMANPVHTEAVLNLSGPVDLIPFLLALAALTAYASHAYEPEPWKFVLALILFAFAALPYAANAYLILVLVLYEFLITDFENRNASRLLPFALIALIGLVRHWGTLAACGFSPARMFGPLYFVFYPIGFLPETVERFQAHPSFAWAAAACVVFILFLIVRKARVNVILFGLLAMAAVRLYPGARPVDPVHLVGGGQLLLANVLFNVALVGLFLRIMTNVRWRVPMIGFTTALAVAFFAMQIRENCIWHAAGREVRAFQRQAAESARAAGRPLAVCPDYAYRLGAPLCLSESIRYDTPFSSPLPAVSILPIHKAKSGDMDVWIDEWTGASATVTVTGARPREVMPWLFRPAAPPPAVSVELIEVTADSFTLRITPNPGDTLPRTVVPPP
ncbi:MAG: hypothetical protein JXR94_05220, partial [Candidatus Hydrogenedentes bacterium]|nr:hypothetical protein [Candidatus Hydrogenedentota bacterium]